MKASFDGARINLARAYNSLANTDLSSDQVTRMQVLRMHIGGLLSMYDESMQPDDGHDLSETINLIEVEP